MPKKKPKKQEPLWKGPEVDGVTQSMLGDFDQCRERFRIKYILGLQPVDAFKHTIEYGNMWHIMEENYARPHPDICDKDGIPVIASNAVRNYAYKLCRKYPLQQEQIEHWWRVCRTQFPIYLDYWEKHQDKRQTTSLLQEETFSVPYKLPSGRVVILRGKWDEIILLGKGKNARNYLKENKTKGDIKEEQMKRQLSFDAQTGIYLVALIEGNQQAENVLRKKCPQVLLGWEKDKLPKLSGLLYNVVRRPLSGGKHSIKQYKPTKKNPRGESSEEFYNRLGGLITENPEHYFMRWKVEITQEDIEKFKREFLDPILEQLCDWWEWIQYCRTHELSPFKIMVPGGPHWRTPYGFWNSLAEGRTTELDEYLASGSTLGLEKTDKLFKELD